RGYVSYAAHEVSVADRSFQEAIAQAPDSVRCVWTDLGVLFSQERESGTPEMGLYEKTPCGPGRDATNRIVWWLADPLYTEPANERRAEHYSRLVMIVLRSATPAVSERWS